jgi:hypothetical protein
MYVIGREVETVVEDDDGFSAFYVKWLDGDGYFLVAKKREDAQIYCEFNDKSNGFISDTVTYTIRNSSIIFRVSGGETFDSCLCP